jgi:hypothetical protein
MLESHRVVAVLCCVLFAAGKAAPATVAQQTQVIDEHNNEAARLQIQREQADKDCDTQSGVCSRGCTGGRDPKTMSGKSLLQSIGCMNSRCLPAADQCHDKVEMGYQAAQKNLDDRFMRQLSSGLPADKTSNTSGLVSPAVPAVARRDSKTTTTNGSSSSESDPLLASQTASPDKVDALSKGFEDLLKQLDDKDARGNASQASCDEAKQLLDKGLVEEWDRANSQQVNFSDLKGTLQDIKNQVASDSWWAASSGPDVAREVKFLADAFDHSMALLFPEAEVVAGLRNAGFEISAFSAKLYQTIKAGGSVISMIREGMHGQGTVEMYAWVWGELGGRPANAALLFKDILDRANTAREAAEYKATVRERLDSLNRQIEAAAKRAATYSGQQSRIAGFQIALQQAIASGCTN